MKILRLILLSLTASTGSLASAQSPALLPLANSDQSTISSARFPSHRLHGTIVAALDIDRDGVISTSEMVNAPTVLRALDLNGDGVLATDELRRIKPSRPSVWPALADGRANAGGRMSSSFLVAFALDANHDGEIQMAEIANAALSLKALDVNGDGQLSANELRPGALLALHDS